MNKKYKIILFDLDNTLVDDDENRKYAIKKILYERDSFDDNKVTKFIEIDNNFWKDRASGKIKDPYEFRSELDRTNWVRAQRFIMFFNVSLDEAISINNKYINYLKEKIIPIKHANEILKYLYNKKYKIYIITNSPVMVVDNKLSKSGLKKYISGIFTAEEACHMKPHEEFFKIVFNRLGIENKGKMFIVGDELGQDIAGANIYGIDSCWFNNRNKINTSKYIPNYEISDLLELENIL